MKVEQYTDKNGMSCVRIKFMDKFRTEVVLSENEFIRQYGNIEQYIV